MTIIDIKHRITHDLLFGKSKIKNFETSRGNES